MKIIILFLFTTLSCNSYGQFNYPDTALFDKTLYEKIIEPNIDKLKLKEQNIYLLNCVSLYNFYIGRILKNEIIKPKFYFAPDSSISFIEYFFSGNRIDLASLYVDDKNGYNISVESGKEGTFKSIKLENYRHNLLNGISIVYESGHSLFSLQKSYFRDDRPVGRFTSYYPGGKIKVDGDSLSAVHPAKIKVPVYNENGEIVRYIFRISYETKKKGKWKYYDENGKLKEEKKYE